MLRINDLVSNRNFEVTEIGVFENCLERARARVIREHCDQEWAAGSFRTLNYGASIVGTRITCNPQPNYGVKMNNRTSAKDVEETLKNIDSVSFHGGNNGCHYPETDGVTLNKIIPVSNPEKKQQIIDRLNKALTPILKELHEEKVTELESVLRKKS